MILGRDDRPLEYGVLSLASYLFSLWHIYLTRRGVKLEEIFRSSLFSLKIHEKHMICTDFVRKGAMA
jgi:hypothetical protein